MPSGLKTILSDTVGFISDLPTALVAAFRATLEEVLAADIILHVRDIAHEDTTAQSQDVIAILAELGIEANDRRLIEIWNKVDLLPPDARESLANQAQRRPDDARPVLLSAQTGEGIDRLDAAIESRLAQARLVIDLVLDPADGSGLSWLYRHTEVLGRDLAGDGRLHVTVRGNPEQAAQVRAKFGEAVLL
jgi:GTP-binding protein HflX